MTSSKTEKEKEVEVSHFSGTSPFVGINVANVTFGRKSTLQ